MTPVLAAFYDQLPPLDCKGLCGLTCGPIGISDFEAQHLQNDGIGLPTVVDHPTCGKLTCSHLTAASRCGIYERRPMICRLFGVVEGMKCPHGRKPKGGHMKDAHAHGLMSALDTITGRAPYFSDGKRP